MQISQRLLHAIGLVLKILIQSSFLVIEIDLQSFDTFWLEQILFNLASTIDLLTILKRIRRDRFFATFSRIFESVQY